MTVLDGIPEGWEVESEGAPVGDAPPLPRPNPRRPAGAIAKQPVIPDGWEIEPPAGPAPTSGVTVAIPDGWEIEQESAPLQSKTGAVPGDYIRESVKGVAAGGTGAVATATKGVAALDPDQAYRRDISRYRKDLVAAPAMPKPQLQALYNRIKAEPSPITRRIMMQELADVLDGKTTPDQIAAIPEPTRLSERPIYQAGERMQARVDRAFKAAPGWEESVTRQLSEGAGSLGVGVVASLIPGVGPAMASGGFTAMGVGEAADNAVAFDKKEKAAGRPGLTDAQMATAAILGVGPGATDMIPVEFLLGAFKVPPIARRPLARAIVRVGGQAFIEGIQEGGQQYLQNLIEREIYNPQKDVGENIPKNIALGAGVGGISQTVVEIAKLFGGRRVRTPPPQPQPQPGATARPGAQPEAPPAPETAAGAPGTPPPSVTPPTPGQPAPEAGAGAAPLPNASPEEAGILRAAGYADEDIADMGRREVAKAVADARKQGVNLPKVDLPTAGPAWPITEEAPAGEAIPEVPASEMPEADMELPAIEAGAEDEVPAGTAEAPSGQPGLTAEEAAWPEDVRKIHAEPLIKEVNNTGTYDFAPDPDSKTGWAVFKGDEKIFAAEDMYAAAKGGLAEIRRRKTATAPEIPEGWEVEGKRPTTVEVTSAADVEGAGAVAAKKPTDAQKEAGNYQKGHLKLHGLDITVENAKGSERTGKGADGKPWSVTVPATYGYIKRTTGADGDQVDVYVGDSPESQKVFVVDQANPESGEFDEHKAMLGFNSREEAVDAYSRGFSDGRGPDRIGGVTEMSVDEFKAWAKSGNTKAPLAPQMKGQKVSTPSETAKTGEKPAAVSPEKPTMDNIAAGLGEIFGEQPAAEEKPQETAEVTKGQKGSETPAGEVTEEPETSAEEGTGPNAREVMRSKEWKAVFGKQTNTNFKPHPESPVAAEMVKGWLDAKAGKLPPEVAPVESARMGGFNPINPYLMGYIGGKWGDAFVVRATDAPDTAKSIRDGTFDKEPEGAGPEGTEATEPEKPAETSTEDIFDEAIDEQFGASEEAVAEVTAEITAVGENPESDPELVSTAAQMVDEGLPVAEAIEQAAFELDEQNEQPIVTETVEDEITVIPTLEDAKDATQPDDAQEDQGPAGEEGGEPEGRPEGGAVASGEETPAGGKGGGKKTGKLTAEERAKRLAEKIKKQQQAKKDEEEKPDRLEDAGEKIGGARKDAWRDRGLDVSDLEGMTEEERTTFTTKENVWPRPNYETLVTDGGVNPAAAYLIKVIYDRIGTAPVENYYQSDTSLEADYVTAVSTVRDLTTKVKTVADAQAVEKAFEELVLPPRDERGSRSSTRYHRLLRTAGIKRGKRHVTELSLRIYSADIAKAEQAVKNGFPNEAPWTRRFKIRADRGYNWQTKEYAKEEVYWVAHKSTGSRIDGGPWKTREEAEAAATAAYELWKEGRAKDGEAIPVRPHLDNLKRVGPDYREGRNVTSEDFISVFGFRGVEYGNWVAGDERQKVVNLAYDAFMDLARVMGVPPKAISLDGTLAIGFGSRGKGGKAAAHYEGDRRVINMTKISGAGSLAHEWAHALDHYLGWFSGHHEVARFSLKPLLSERLRRAAYDLMTAFYTKPEDVADLKTRLEKAVADGERGRESWAAYVRTLDEQIAKAKGAERAGLQRSRSKAIKQVEVWDRDLTRRKNRLANATRGMRGTVSTEYAKAADRLSGQGDYWKRGTEMLARAFEAYVFDRITAEGNASEYLVHGTEGTRYASGYKGNPYPTGEERILINRAMDKFIDEIDVDNGKNGAKSRITGVLGPVDEEKKVDTGQPVDLTSARAPIDEPLEADEKASSAEKPTVSALVLAFRDFFLSPDKSFATITEARLYAREKGHDAKPGTPEAKAIDEQIEAGLVLAARDIVRMTKDPMRAYWRLVDLYHRQPNLAVRSSKSMAEQAYSTPLPLAFIASHLAGVREAKSVLEPTAGNGALLIEANPKTQRIVANELDATRASALRATFPEVSEVDAAAANLTTESVEVVIANPPFGSVKEEDGSSKTFTVNDWKTTQIDHAIALNALEKLNPDGRAVLIVGAVKEGSDKTRSDAYNSKQKREFYWRLYQAYNVVDHFTVSGDLYQKQGAGWPVDVIVIEGRGKSSRPLPAVDLPRIYAGWDDLKDKFDDAQRTSVPVGDRDDAGTAPEAGAGLEGLGAADRAPAGGAGAVVTQPAAGERDELRPRGDRGERNDLGEQPAPGTVREEVAPGQERQPDRTGPRASDLDALFDEAVNEQFGTAGEAATAAASEAGAGLADVASGLGALFGAGDKNRFSAGFTFDEETYAKAKPFFQQAMAHFKASAANVQEAMRLLVKELATTFGWTRERIVAIKPYVVRFIDEMVAAAKAVATDAAQVAYKPTSKQQSLGLLVPANMATATQDALAELRGRRGDLDAWLAGELGYDVGEIGQYLAAEQIDAAALALDNVKKGGAFIIGDQTGIGKGRVVAAMMRYALRNNLTPLFVTHKPNLYGDIVRDLNDIGVPAMLGRPLNVFMTNSTADVPLDSEALDWFSEKEIARASGDKVPARRGQFLTGLKGKAYDDAVRAIAKDGAGPTHAFDMVFTTYNQMQTVAGKDTLRRQLVRRIAERSFVVMDESHNAGGAGPAGWGAKSLDDLLTAGTGSESVAQLFRVLVKRAAAVMYSSATYAKRPDVMDLYARTDMGQAVTKPEALGPLIAKGGVPMQQVVASMLTEAGQYIRRERSFDGVEYGLEPVEVDEAAYEQFSEGVQGISRFDLTLKKSDFWKSIMDSLKEEAEAGAADVGTGEAGVTSSTFGSVMHNLVSQMLLALKADQAATLAIEAIKRGEKPVLTVSNTMGSFIEEYVDEHNLKRGAAVDLTFRNLLRRYLARTLRLTVKKPDGTRYHIHVEPVPAGEPVPASKTVDGVKTIYRHFPDDLQWLYDNAGETIATLNVSALPISPIDWIHHRLQEAGFRTGEITGRQHVLRYDSLNSAKYDQRKASEVSTAGRRLAIERFNNEDGTPREIHAIILNRAGSTGLSLHASRTFKNQKRRRMLIVQAELNIDDHMQMLGRIHRTGQVVAPVFGQIFADVPAEARPAAVLAKKMASLNANTTAARRSKFSADEAVDFLNQYGDEVVAQLLVENPDLAEATGVDPGDGDEEGEGAKYENLATKFTGKLTLLPPSRQREVLDEIATAYKALIALLDASGENALEAKTMDLQAETVQQDQLKAGTGKTPFTRPVFLDTVRVKAAGKAMPLNQIVDRIRGALNLQGAVAEDPVEALKDIEARRRDPARAFLTKWLDIAQQRGQRKIDEFKNSGAKEAERRRQSDLQARFGRLFSLVAPGQVVMLTSDEGAAIQGITMEVKRRDLSEGGGGDVFAPGAWSVEIAVPDNAQRIIVPFTALQTADEAATPPVKGDEKPKRKYTVLSPRTDWESVAQAFADAAKTGTETRHIITGNILAGYDIAKGKGQIVNYTGADGAVRAGILQKRDFKAAQFLETRPVYLVTARQVIAFADQSEAKESKSGPGEIVIKRERYGSWEISLSSARASGGRFFLLPQIRQLSGDGFTKAGNRMKFVTPDTDKVTAIVDAMIKAGAEFIANTEQALADRIVTADAPKNTGPVMPNVGDRPLFHDGAAIFYSAVLRAVEAAADKGQKKATAAQWLTTIKNTPGVKQEEIDWLGLEDWLKGQTGPVLGKDVWDFIRANQIEVNDSIRGSGSPDLSERRAALIREYDQWIDQNDMPRMSADELLAELAELDQEYQALHDEQNPRRRAQMNWLGDFIERSGDLDEEENIGVGPLDTRWGNLVLPGGENYSELVLTLPDRLPPGYQFVTNPNDGPNGRTRVINDRGTLIGEWPTRSAALKSQRRVSGGNFLHESHWGDTVNPVAHVRFNERTDADGKRTLFIEEIQSDWHQAGRKRGYRGQLPPGHTIRPAESDNGGYWIVDERGNGIAWGATEAAALAKMTIGVPDAPFKTTWPELALKRMIRWAAENGFDQVAWTPGIEQVKRWEAPLRQQVRKITWARIERGPNVGKTSVSVVDKEGGLINFHVGADGVVTSAKQGERRLGEAIDQPIEDLVGKEIARRIMEEPSGSVEGDNLVIGGKGFEDFYDKILVNAANKLGKKFGAKVGRTTINQYPPEAPPFGSSLAEKYAPVAAHALPITPEMRKAAMQGFPLFTPGGAALVIGKEEEKRLERAGQALARQILGHAISVRLVSKEEMGEGFAASYWRDSKAITLAAYGAHQFIHNVGHEALHALRKAGVFTENEWNILAAAAKRLGFGNFSAWQQSVWHDTYVNKQGFSEAALNVILEEEAVAELMGAYVKGRVFDHRPTNRIARKITQFIEAIVNLAKGLGLSSSFGIMERALRGAYRGQVAVANELGFEGSPEYAHRNMRMAQAGRNTDTAAFREWFGDSKVVNPDGSPQVVYHGTAKRFDAFDKGKIGSRNGNSADGFAFTSDRSVAEGYKGKSLFGRGEVQAVYLSLKNPRIVDMADHPGDTVRMMLTKGIVIDGARSDGHDGVIFKNIADNADLSDRRSDVYIAFEPTQIKSVANRGTFDRTNESIMANVAPENENQIVAPQIEPGRFDPTRIAVQDRMLRLRRWQEAVERVFGIAVPETLDAYKAEERYHGRVNERLKDLHEEWVKPFARDLRAAGIRFADMGQYLYARHAPRRNEVIREINPDLDAGSGMTDEEAEAIVTRLEARNPAYQALADRVYAMIAQQRDILVESGLLSEEERQAWEEKMGPEYVPLRGFEADPEVDDRSPDGALPGDIADAGTPAERARTGRGFDLRGREAKRALGRRSRADNPLAFAIMQAEQAIVRAEKNGVAQTFLRFARSFPNPRAWRIVRAEMRRRVNPQTGMVETYAVPPAFSRADNLFGVKIGGKTTWIEIHDKRLVRALRGYGNADTNNAVFRGAIAIARLFAALQTQFSPEFVAANFVRDLETAVTNVGDTPNLPRGTRVRIVKDALTAKAIRGIMSALYKRDSNNPYRQWFDEFRHAGGKVSFYGLSKDVEAIKKEIEREITRGQVMRGVRHLIDAVERVNTAVENGARLSVYVRLREAGVSEGEAASVALNLTVNFHRKGEWGPLLNTMYVFFNAAVQGTTRSMQAVLRSRRVRGTVVGIMFLGMALDLINYLLAGDDDDDGRNDYDAIPDYVKEQNLVLMIPGGGGRYIKLPLGFGIVALPFVSGQQIAATARGARQWDEAAGTIAYAALAAFNPLGYAATLSQYLSPTLLDPIIQSSENKKWFGGPIAPQKFDRRKPDSEDYFADANPQAVAFAKWMNRISGGSEGRPGLVDISPETIEHYVEFAGGGAARFVLNGIKTGRSFLTADEWLPENTPFVRRLYSEPTTQSRMGEFYDAWREVDQAQYEVKQLRKRGEFAAARTAERENREAIRAYPRLKAAKKTLDDIDDRIDQIEGDDTMPADRQQRTIEELNARRRDIVTRALRAYRPE